MVEVAAVKMYVGNADAPPLDRGRSGTLQLTAKQREEQVFYKAEGA